MSVVSALRRRISLASNDGVQLLFSLHLRTIGLDARLEYDRMSQTVTGHEDYGYLDRRHFNEEFEEQNLAAKALIFVLNGLNADVYVPIAYFMMNSK